MAPSYEPYADQDFPSKLAVEPDARFWEMYLATQFLSAGKKLLKRSEVGWVGDHDEGPDICIRKGTRKIWIEAISPTIGDETNPDRIQELELGKVHTLPRRQLELRISGALNYKAEKFRKYREAGIIGERDSAIVAVSGGRFSFEAIGSGLSVAVTALYPFGTESYFIDPQTSKVSGPVYAYSGAIQRAQSPKESGNERKPIKRTAFDSEDYQHISGLIWSRIGIGNFLVEKQDFVYGHNRRSQRPIPRRWVRFCEQYYPVLGEDRLVRRLRR